ncbi:MAG: lysophospholipid acyltransferase family protein [Oligoflexia bacterium]|nr:lysophospholipid acyltransferase family protein [Oligoflexia bacterium]
MSTRAATAFFKTALYASLLVTRDQALISRYKPKWAADVLKTLGFELTVNGSPPLDGACILVGNHVSYLDIPVVMASEAAAVFIAKDDLLKWPLIGVGAKGIGTIFVSRKSGADRSAAREAVAERLSQPGGDKVVVFPSGTTTLDESKPWKRGIFEIAKASKIPVQLFHIQYHPTRESAYIDDDNLLVQMSGLSKVKNKTATLTWLDRYDEIDDPAVFAESLRHKVRARLIPESACSP